MTKVRAGLACRAKAASLDRLEAELQRLVQPRQFRLGHLVISVREGQIEVPLGQPGRCIAGDAAILYADTDRLHSSKPTLPDASRKCRGGAPVRPRRDSSVEATSCSTPQPRRKLASDECWWDHSLGAIHEEPSVGALAAFGAAEAGNLQISAPRPMVIGDLDDGVTTLFPRLVEDPEL